MPPVLPGVHVIDHVTCEFPFVFLCLELIEGKNSKGKLSSQRFHDMGQDITPMKRGLCGQHPLTASV